MGRSDKYWSRSFRKSEKESVGCMTGVLQLFDFHHQQQLYTDSVQGLEAPRNSLELEYLEFSSAALAAIEEDLQIPCIPKSIEKESSSETTSLQRSKTPNLVARLMGLDILPDQVSSPPMHRRTLSSHLRPLQIRENSEMGTRSLPDTPRISAARGSDVDPRLSLQLNKENLEMPEFSYFSRSVSRRDSISTSSSNKKLVVRERRSREESRSPRAREIVKQVKESVKRRVGMDITNVSCRSCDESGKKTKRMSRLSEESKRSEQQSTSSWSPRLRYLEKKIKRIENKEPISVSISESPKLSSSKSYQSSSSSLSSTSTTLESLLLKESEEAKAKALPKSTTKCKKANCERFTQRAKSPNSTQISRKKRKTPFSKALRLQFHPSSNATETPLQTVVTSPLHSAALSPHHHHHHQCDQDQQQPPQKPNTPLLLDQDNSSIPTTLSDSAAELLYVTTILDRTIVSIDHPTVPFTSWFSPSHPLDPSLFDHLEHSFQSSSSSDGPLNHKSNRRLLFDFVDEILCTSLKLHLMIKPWLQREKARAFNREELVEQVGSKVGGFGSAKCETQQDIDGLVELEPWEGGRGRWCCYSAMDEEREAFVFEMEHRILESLIEEALIFL